MHLERHGKVCQWASDIEPQHPLVGKQDALTGQWPDARQFITNPPWSRKILHPLIDHLRVQAPTWLLFDADWIHTQQSVGYKDGIDRAQYCHKIVSVGRVSWEQNGVVGKDNCAWHLFKAEPAENIVFIPPKLRTRKARKS